jgi:phosphohistidine phosphatase SixA
MRSPHTFTLHRFTPLRFVFICALVLAAAIPSTRAAELSEADLLKRIAQGGVVLMVRHAQTVSGIGDPPGFDLAKCATQRNLDARGRDQARALGSRLARAGVRPTRVLSSAWCRCKDTAQLAFGSYTVLPELNSFFEDRRTEPAQTAALRERLGRLATTDIEVWVTHQVNIQALAGVSPAMGETVVLAAGQPVRVLGRLAQPVP